MNDKLSHKVKKFVKFIIESPYMITDTILNEAKFDDEELTNRDKISIVMLSLTFKMQT